MFSVGRAKFALYATVGMLAVAGCQKPATPPPPPPPTVEVITLQTQPVQNFTEFPGRVQAVRTAEVRARVDGIVQRRLYQEGTDVRAGQPLFQIDPRQMQAAYDSAVAALRRAQANATNAGQVVGRYRPLVREQAISSQEYDAAVAAQRSGHADVASARAAVDRARLDLAYTTVTAPISGRAGRAEVTEGALVSGGSATLMTRIEQLDPVYVNFSSSSSEVLRVRRDMANGALIPTNGDRAPVRLHLEDGSEYGMAGYLNFLDLAVDEGTGTVSLRAQFPNPRRILLPGQFVTARANAGVSRRGMLLPQRAVQVSPTGASVIVVGRDSVAQPRPIQVGDLQGDQWVVKSGLKPGDRVIVNGLQKVRPGSKVEVVPYRPVRSGPAPAGTSAPVTAR